MSVYSSTLNERKATNNAWNAYRHIIEEVYGTCTDEALNNLIHNVEVLSEVLENPTLELLEPYDQKQTARMISHKVENRSYPKL